MDSLPRSCSQAGGPSSPAQLAVWGLPGLRRGSESSGLGWSFASTLGAGGLAAGLPSSVAGGRGRAPDMGPGPQLTKPERGHCVAGSGPGDGVAGPALPLGAGCVSLCSLCRVRGPWGGMGACELESCCRLEVGAPAGGHLGGTGERDATPSGNSSFLSGPSTPGL